MANAVTNKITTIKGTGIICKGNLKGGEFEMFPTMLFDYVQLGLITHTNLVVYVKLLQLYNENYGYAFPTIPQLMIYTRIRSKATIHHSLDTLEEVGLIQRSKKSGGNNIYVVYKPLSKTELYSFFPDKTKKLKEDEEKLMKTAEHDKERYQQHQQQKEQVQEQQIQAEQVVPNFDTFDNKENYFSSLKELARRARQQVQ
ncbi:transcriptional regulator [Ectobacillus antri]|uniref:Transcriptional regulator n=1 Tax=Ectobacillus antri TaxID=2486280 RepID=A0ABT6H3K7_9BACI|nr:transcriptional regulator [Ectobacillus antri]MDG4655546.1 transcriptional regulator [Ectobacillus antri]MDG5753304.1 transcriptional regulator [Ectobacillus antri]